MRRRRILQLILATAGTLPVGGAGLAAPPLFGCRTPALGTTAAFSVVAEDAGQARDVLRPLVAELRRLEAIFSLFDPASAVATLNRTGALDAPPPELVELLQLCRRLQGESRGAFDPTVQPLYAALATHFSRSRTAPPPALLDAARERVGFHRVHLRPERIELVAWTALTLNGVAQGWIADRLVALARAHGLEAALFDTGELAALGRPPGRAFWTVAARPGAVPATRFRLRDRALAVSHAGATRFDAEGRWNHILDPRTGRPAPAARAAVVVAESAAVADGLSTALCLLPPVEGVDLLRRFPVERASIVDADGGRHVYAA